MGAAAIPVAVSVGSSLASAGISALSQNEQAKAEARALRAQREFARIQAADLERLGERQAAAHRAEGSMVVGAQLAAQAAMGTDASGGTAARLAAESRAASEADAELARNDAARQAWGLRTQGAMLEDRAKDVRRAGRLGAGMTLLGGALNAAAQGYSSYGSYRNSAPSIGARMASAWGEDGLNQMDALGRAPSPWARRG